MGKESNDRVQASLELVSMRWDKFLASAGTDFSGLVRQVDDLVRVYRGEAKLTPEEFWKKWGSQSRKSRRGDNG